MSTSPKMSPGGALRLRRYDASGGPELVKVDRYVARRAVFERFKWLTDPEGAERHCALFRDPKTDEWYGQPTAEDS